MFSTGQGSPSQRKGLHFEKLALNFLRKQGLKQRCKNFHCRFGEIDLILQHDEILVFVEVRFRASKHYGDALETVNWHKQQKLIKCAQYYLLQQGLYERCDSRFDVVSIHESGKDPHIHWLQNAFSLTV